MDDDITALDEQPFICRRIPWTNCTGIDIDEYQLHCGVPPDSFARFRMNVTLSTTEGQQLANKIVQVEAETLEEAFAMAPGVVERTHAELVEFVNEEVKKRQQPKPEIITAAQARAMDDNGNHQQRRVDAAQHNRMKGNF